MNKYRVGDEVYDLPPGCTIVKAYGDVHTIYDLCGRMGLCPGCTERGVKMPDGCGKWYIFSSTGGVEQWSIQFPSGEELVIDEVWQE